MKTKVAILLVGYYPHFSTIGQVFAKLHDSLGDELDMTFLHTARPNDERESQYKGSRVIPVTCWRHSLWLNKGKFSRITKILFKLLYYCFCAWRLQTKEEYLEGAYLASLKRLYREWKFEAIITMAMPFFMHRAANRFCKSHPDIRHVTYSADTTIGSETRASCVPVRFLRPLFMRLENRREIRAYEEADYNFMSVEIYRNNKRYFKHITEKCSPLQYPLFNSDCFLEQNQGKDAGEVQMVYAGGFVPNLREPDYFIAVLSHLPEDCKLVWHVYLTVGRRDRLEEAARRYPSRIVLHDPVSAVEVRKILTNADMLINVGNDSDLFSPSKLYDYFSTGRPIVNISYAGRQRNADFDKYPFLLDMENYKDEYADAERLYRFSLQYSGRRLPFSKLQQLYPSHDPVVVANCFKERLSC